MGCIVAEYTKELTTIELLKKKKKHLQATNNLKNNWKHFLQSDEINQEQFSQKDVASVWRRQAKAYNFKTKIPTESHSEGNIILRGYFSGHGVGNLVKVHRTMKNLIFGYF